MHRRPDDLVIERGGARVLIDQVSLGYLAGSEIDFVDDLIGSSFKITNPNATASCGCGTSFSHLIAAEVAHLRPAASKRWPSRCAAATFSPHLQRLSRLGIAPQGTAPLSEGGKTLRMRGLSAWVGLAGILLGTPVGAQTGLDKRMQALEPHTRMIQLCNLSGLETFAKDKKVAEVRSRPYRRAGAADRGKQHRPGRRRSGAHGGTLVQVQLSLRPHQRSPARNPLQLRLGAAKFPKRSGKSSTCFDGPGRT